MSKQNPMKMPTITEGTLLPAYGRDYTSKVDAITAFRKGVDFLMTFYGGSTYCSIRDCKAGDMVKLRYAKKKKACFYTVTWIDVF